MRKFLLSTFSAIALVAMSSMAQAECVSANAAGGVGYVNIREKPDLNARIVTRLNNPETGSDWGAAKWCGQEYTDYDGRVWSYIYVTMQDGVNYSGWVSDRVFEFFVD